MTSKPDITGEYRHHKGGKYDVIGLAKHSETGERFVVYASRDNPDTEGLMIIRPEEMFFESVVLDGIERLRFEKVKDEGADSEA